MTKTLQTRAAEEAERLLIYADGIVGANELRVGLLMCNDAMRTAAALITELVGQVREWRPISEAPKDGTFVILFCPEDGSRWWASWQGDRWHGVDEVGLTREGHSVGSDAVTGWFLTGWQPLPPPPEEKK